MPEKDIVYDINDQVHVTVIVPVVPAGIVKFEPLILPTLVETEPLYPGLVAVPIDFDCE